MFGTGVLPSDRGAAPWALRCLTVHWRFQVLANDYPRDEPFTPSVLQDWCLGVRDAVRDLLGTRNSTYENMQRLSQLMMFGDDSELGYRPPPEVLREMRDIADIALHSAAAFEEANRTHLRVVDLHPWIAEPAERLFDDGHYSQAILAAAQNLEVQWRKLLGVADGSLSELATRSFSADDPKPDRPRLRFPETGDDTKSDPWKNAHLGAMKYAEGCAMRIRNLNLHHPDDDEPSVGLTIETLSALSVLARWVTDAQVKPARPPWMNLPRGGGPR